MFSYSDLQTRSTPAPFVMSSVWYERASTYGSQQFGMSAPSSECSLWHTKGTFLVGWFQWPLGGLLPLVQGDLPSWLVSAPLGGCFPCSHIFTSCAAAYAIWSFSCRLHWDLLVQLVRGLAHLPAVFYTAMRHVTHIAAS